MQSSLVFLEYLNTGLIPIKSFDQPSIEEFDNFIKTLSPEEKRVATRKFRKIFREIIKKEINSSRNPDITLSYLIKRYGYTIKKPNKWQMRARRRLVHNQIVKDYERKFGEEK